MSNKVYVLGWKKDGHPDFLKVPERVDDPSMFAEDEGFTDYNIHSWHDMKALAERLTAEFA